MMSTIIKFITATVAILVICISASAETAVPTPANAPKPKKTTVNFEDQLIEGQAQKPDLMYLLQKKKFNYKKLIRLRENFLPELRQTGNEIAPAKKSKEK
ncbi:MAG: hypothetical protein IT287_06940 [Bdellovibrionaceae bacterium]|nr:hypothetical protein [Pseudobdellovibrionaceae bacterium]